MDAQSGLNGTGALQNCKDWKAFRCRAAIACDRTGTSITPLREAVLRGLWKAELPLSAYELASVVSENLGRGIAANSIYRILELYSAAGLVRRVERTHAYCVVRLVSSATDILMMCDDCGHLTEVSANCVRTLLNQCSGKFGFHPSARPIEVAGRCLDCSRELNTNH